MRNPHLTFSQKTFSFFMLQVSSKLCEVISITCSSVVCDKTFPATSRPHNQVNDLIKCILLHCAVIMFPCLLYNSILQLFPLKQWRSRHLTHKAHELSAV